MCPVFFSRLSCSSSFWIHTVCSALSNPILLRRFLPTLLFIPFSFLLRASRHIVCICHWVPYSLQFKSSKMLKIPKTYIRSVLYTYSISFRIAFFVDLPFLNLYYSSLTNELSSQHFSNLPIISFSIVFPTTVSRVNNLYELVSLICFFPSLYRRKPIVYILEQYRKTQTGSPCLSCRFLGIFLLPDWLLSSSFLSLLYLAFSYRFFFALIFPLPCCLDIRSVHSLLSRLLFCSGFPFPLIYRAEKLVTNMNIWITPRLI